MKKLFLLIAVTTLALAPACKQQPRGRAEVITGSVFNGLGVASAFAILPFVWAIPALVALPAGFFAVGIPLFEIGKEEMRFDAVSNAHTQQRLNDKTADRDIINRDFYE